MLFAGPFAPQFIFLVDLKVVVGDVVVGVFLVSAVLLFYGLIEPGLQIQIEAVKIVQTAVHRLQGRGHGLKELLLLVVGLLLGAGIEDTGVDQQTEDGVEVEVDLEPVLVTLEEGVDPQFVVELFEEGIAQILQADLIFGNLSLRVQREMNGLRFTGLLNRALFGNFPEVSDGVVVQFFEVIQIAEGLDVFLSDLAVFAIPVREGEKDPAVLAAIFLHIHGSRPSK